MIFFFVIAINNLIMRDGLHITRLTEYNDLIFVMFPCFMTIRMDPFGKGN